MGPWKYFSVMDYFFGKDLSRVKDVPPQLHFIFLGIFLHWLAQQLQSEADNGERNVLQC